MHSIFTPLAELRALFRSRPAFRQVLLADVIAQLGDGGLLIAFPMLVIERTHDLSLSGLAFSGEILAYGLLAPIGGCWADRLEQKRVMLAADAARAMLLATIIAALAWHVPVGVLLMLSLSLGASGAFFQPARAAFLRRIVAPEELPRVVALEGTVAFMLRLVSPPLMGLLLAVEPATVGIEVAIAAYVLSALSVMPRWVTGPRLAAHGDGDDWRAGWRFIMAHRELRGLMSIDACASVVGTAAFSTTVALLSELLGLPAQDNGWLLATTGLTGAIGTQVASRVGQRRWTYPLITGVLGLTYLLVPLAGSLPALLCMWGLRGLAVGAFCVLVNQRIAAEVPAAVMGRVQAAWGLAACVAAASGAGLTPLLLRHLGAPASYTLFGAVLLGQSLVLVFRTYGAPVRLREPELVEVG